MINPQIEESVERITDTFATIAALMVELREEDRKRQDRTEKKLESLSYEVARISGRVSELEKVNKRGKNNDRSKSI